MAHQLRRSQLQQRYRRQYRKYTVGRLFVAVATLILLRQLRDVMP